MGLGSKILAGIVAGTLASRRRRARGRSRSRRLRRRRRSSPPPRSTTPRATRSTRRATTPAAETEFKAADDIKSAPQTERFIGLCEDRQGHLQTAVDWYDRFLAHVPDKMAEQGEEIRKREAEIKAIPGKVHVESNPPGANVVVDDRPQSAPTPMDVELAPGSHVVKLSAPGACRRRRRSTSPSPRARRCRRTSTPSRRRAPPPPPRGRGRASAAAARARRRRRSRAARCPPTSPAGSRSSRRASARRSASWR